MIDVRRLALGPIRRWLRCVDWSRHWPPSLNRWLYVGMVLAGLGAIALSVRKPWFGVTMPADSGFAGPAIDGWPGFISADVPATPIYRGFMVIGAVAVLAGYAHRRCWTVLSNVTAAGMLLVAMTFPYAVMIRCPTLAAQAAYLQAQHDNLTWLGGDIYAGAEFGSRGDKVKTYLIDTPKQLSVVRLPSWSPWEFGLHRCEDLMRWVGYTNVFCQFVGKGWAMAVVGSVMLYLASLGHRGELVFARAGVTMTVFTVGAAVMSVIGWAVPFAAVGWVRSAAEASSVGDDQLSLDHLHRAVDWMPVLSQDTYYVAQRGVLDARLDRDTDFRRLGEVVAHEAAGRYEAAWDGLVPLMDSSEPAVAREATRAVFRFAIQDFNSGRLRLADQRLRMVHRRQPCDVKAIYVAQILAIRNGRVRRSAEMRDHLRLAADQLNFGTTKVLRAVSEQNQAVAVGTTTLTPAPDRDRRLWDAIRKARRP